MKKIILSNYEEMSKAAANVVVEQVNKKPNTVLGLATGGTPVGMYQKLIESYKKGEVDFSKVVTFNLDEYYRISRDNEQSYYYYMFSNLFNGINIPKENIHIPNGDAKDVEKECNEYDALINQFGGIDLQVLGIGSNGHIGFNEPADELNTTTHMVKLTEETINDNARFFDNVDDVPKSAITMGLGTILKAKKIILLINGKNKAEIFKKVCEGKITTNIPASLLQLHNDVTVFIDEEAAQKVAS